MSDNIQGTRPGMAGKQEEPSQADDDGKEAPEAQWSEEQIGSALRELWHEYGPHHTRMRVRRMLLELADDAKHDDRTGTHLPKPYDKSKLILKTLIGDAQDVVQNYTARLSANEPQTSVIPVALSRSRVARRVEERAAEQERLLMSQWQSVHGRLAQRQAGVSEDDVERYRLYLGKDGKIAGGVTRGGEPGSQRGRERWTLARFLTRDEVYYYVTETPEAGGGTVIWHDIHGGGQVPLIPVPGMYTDSSAPGAEFASLMESVFALTPIINQIETLLSNVATWDALGRFVIEDPGGQLFADDSGEPLIMSTEDMVGLDPQDVNIVKGRVRQLTIDAGLLFQLLDFYSSRLDRSKPAPVTEGQAAATAAAWQVRQLLESSGELLEQAVSNHAEAVKQVQLLWIRWMRMLDEPIYAFAAPDHRKNDRSVRGLIEFDPTDLVESIRVEQSTQSAQQRVVLRQAGIELLQAGRIDEHEFYEHYDLAEDPEEAVVRAWAQRAVDIVMLGTTSGVDPDSVLADVVKAVRGRITMELLDRSPNFALAQAEQMAAQAAQAAGPVGPVPAGPVPGGPGAAGPLGGGVPGGLGALLGGLGGVPGGPIPGGAGGGPPLPYTASVAAAGNIAAALGIVEPGLGMPINLPGTPLSGAPGGAPFPGAPFPGAGLGPVSAEGASAAAGLA